MSRDLLTTVCLAGLTLLSLYATSLAFRQLRRGGRSDKRQKQQNLLVLLVAVGCALLFLYRWLYLRGTWQPLQSHVDGLLLISALLAGTVFFLENHSRVPGLAAFALPLLIIVQAWSICASRWTFEPFQIHSAWKTMHLAGVYLGTIFLALGAGAGGMYLFVQHKLRDKKDLTGLNQLASLEAVERAIIRSTALGFALLTLGLISGLIVVASTPDNDLGPGWWYSPKILLATATWLVYAMVLNVRHATLFRGARAAWLSICGMALMLATFGVVSAIDIRADTRNHPSPPGKTAPATPAPESP